MYNLSSRLSVKYFFNSSTLIARGSSPTIYYSSSNMIKWCLSVPTTLLSIFNKILWKWAFSSSSSSPIGKSKSQISSWLDPIDSSPQLQSEHSKVRNCWFFLEAAQISMMFSITVLLIYLSKSCLLFFKISPIVDSAIRSFVTVVIMLWWKKWDIH